ncbi:metal-dependent hydrolase [Enterobacter cloacae]|uniref:Metal-dependent hydrolase n=1 Tax=Enterobacter cloacae TaxID=550 RepID=A0A3R8YVB0_ENTCL|nr:metal-dependent hydrolase [Enterobacter cloacae]
MSKQKGKRIFRFSVATLCALAALAATAANAVVLPAVKEYVELNHPIREGMETYPGLSEVELYTKGGRNPSGSIIDGIRLLGISGTYIDAPFHMSDKGGKIADYPLSKLVNLPVIVVEKAAGRRTYEVADFQGKEVKGKAVLLHTGQDRYFGKPAYSKNSPYVSTQAAEWLVGHGAVLVGIDAVLIDDYDHTETTPVHDILLRNGVIIAEDMTNIGAVKGKDAYLTAVSPRVPMASFPARIFATVY